MQKKRRYTNRRIARLYAEFALALLQDWWREQPPKGSDLLLFEPNPGDVSFAFNVLYELEMATGVPLQELPIRYQLGNISPENLTCLQNNPRGRIWWESGQLGLKSPESFENTGPILFCANDYFSLCPADLFYLNDGRVKWGRPGPEVTFEPLPPDIKENPALMSIIEHYEESGQSGYFSIPRQNIQELEEILSQLQGPLIVLCLDQGPRELTDSLAGYAPPDFATAKRQPVNFYSLFYYHQLRSESKDLLLLPKYSRTTGLQNPAFIFKGQEQNWPDLCAYYQKLAAYGSPDDFELQYNFMEQKLETMGRSEIMMALRLNNYDAQLFMKCVNRLAFLSAAPGPRYDSFPVEVLEEVWRGHLHTRDSPDVAGGIALLYYQFHDLKKTRQFVALSQDSHGQTPGNTYLEAMTALGLEEWEEARRACESLLTLSPGHAEGLTLQRRLASSRSPVS